MKNLILVSITSISYIFLIIAFCFGASDIDIVKNGTMQAFQTTTIGNAFDASFDNPKWAQFRGKKGERVVQFTGKISKNLHDTAVRHLLGKEPSQINENDIWNYVNLHAAICERLGEENIKRIDSEKGDKNPVIYLIQRYANDYHWVTGTPVVVKWIISPQGDSFQLNALSSKAWEGIQVIEILKVIYM